MDALISGLVRKSMKARTRAGRCRRDGITRYKGSAEIGVRHGQYHRQIELSEGTWKRTVYWTGDSMPTEDVLNAVEPVGNPDLLVPHVGGVGISGPLGQISMRAADVLALAAAVRPKYALPIHHSTYAFYREPISELARDGLEKPFRLDLVAGGSTVVYR